MKGIRTVLAAALATILALGAAQAAHAATSITISSSANPAVAGQQVTFTVTISPSPATSGSMDFYVDANSQSPDQVSTRIPFDATGKATYTMSFNGLGTHSVQADYGGAYPTTLIQTIIPPPTDPTMTTVGASPDPGMVNGNVTVTAVVVDTANPAMVPTGNVTFESDGAPIGQGYLDPAGHASTDLYELAAGSYSITAVYAGVAATQTTWGWAPSKSSAFSEAIAAAPDATNVQLSSSRNPVHAGEPVTLVAQVTDQAAEPNVPMGQVSFIDNGQALATVGLSSLGYASLTVRLSGGTDHLVAAEFLPQGPWLRSTSDTLDELVVGTARVATPRRCMASSIPVHVAHGAHVVWVGYLVDGVPRAESRRGPSFSVRLPTAGLRPGRHHLTAVLHYRSKARNHPTQDLTGTFKVC